ncbi:unnamed protein product, partial [marine sediment metagenome]
EEWSPLGTMNFEPHNDGTKVDFLGESTIPILLLGKIAEALVLKKMERELDHALANIKDIMET